jgi:peptidoglycan/xylan/chitin deacetylase (PgdA/CDA1 family)
MKSIISICFICLMLLTPQLALGSTRVPILVYHSIAEYKGVGSKELYVTPDNFEKQMRYLKDKGYTLLTFERWNEKNLVEKPIFITFDDGYKNNLNAFNIFQKLVDDQFKPAGTLFVISDYIGSQNRLTKEELKKMVDSNMFSIQSHTALHPDLTKTANFESELKQSKQRIEKVTGKPVIALAYPYGNFNQMVIEETKKYYQFGLTTTPGPFIDKGYKDELYVLPRIYIKHSTTLEDFAKLVQ